MKPNTGVFLIGALGHLATTMMIGAIALRDKAFPRTGMVTELPDFIELGLVEPGELVFGGWDIREGSLEKNGHRILQELGAWDRTGLEGIEKGLRAISDDIYAGLAVNGGKAIEALACLDDRGMPCSLEDYILNLQGHIASFKTKHGLDTLVVVNLASTEPHLPQSARPVDREALERIIAANEIRAVRPSTVYAYAAIGAGCPLINFTPSRGATLPGLVELAVERGVPLMGNDGKTGETLVKSALAPMFACRNLEVLSWEGYNLLGNMDGRVLANPDNKSTKVGSKDHLLGEILGYRPHSKVSIDFVPSLGDWKTAWDFIHFQGFLNTRMSMQFTWQGCDSALAAPLVLDLVRLAELARRRGEKGLMPHLACFFKSPLGVDEHNLYAQFDMLKEYARQLDAS